MILINKTYCASVYLHDIIVIKNEKEIKNLKTHLAKEFEIKDL